MILNNRGVDPFRLAAQALGVPATASEDDVKKAYRKKAQASHPDRHTGDPNTKLHEARFNMATASKELLMGRGSRPEDLRKLVDAFNNAQNSLKDEMKKAGIDPAAQQREQTTRTGFAGGARDLGARTTRDSGRPTGGARKVSPEEAARAKPWTPPSWDDLTGRTSAGSKSSEGARPWTPRDFGEQPQGEAKTSTGPTAGAQAQATSGPQAGAAPGGPQADTPNASTARTAEHTATQAAASAAGGPAAGVASDAFRTPSPEDQMRAYQAAAAKARARQTGYAPPPPNFTAGFAPNGTSAPPSATTTAVSGAGYQMDSATFHRMHNMGANSDPVQPEPTESTLRYAEQAYRMSSEEPAQGKTINITC